MGIRSSAILATILIVVLALVLVSTRKPAQQANDWTEPFPAFRIADNLYYVGSKGLANYLITTPQGHILINSDMEENVPLLRASVESLGFKFSDIKILLISHAHSDHCGASDTIKKLTGAKYMVMEADVSVVESGGKTDFHYADEPLGQFKPTKVDRVLRDGDEVKLGDVVLTARLTPGHTKGCTTWTMKVKDGSRMRDVVIVGSPNVNPGYNLIDSKRYPEMKQDFERTFAVLKSLSCDYFLGAHGSYFGLAPKYEQFKAGAKTAFIDPEGYKGYVSEREQAFRRELAKQQTSTK